MLIERGGEASGQKEVGVIPENLGINKSSELKLNGRARHLGL